VSVINCNTFQVPISCIIPQNDRVSLSASYEIDIPLSDGVEFRNLQDTREEVQIPKCMVFRSKFIAVQLVKIFNAVTEMRGSTPRS
jgi:hypothetical protein